MAAKPGRNAALYVDQYDLRGKLNSIGISMTCDTGEKTVYGNEWREFRYTLKGWTINQVGFFEGSDTAGELDKVMESIFGTSAKVIFLPGGRARGDYGYAANEPLMGQSDVDAPVDGLTLLTSSYNGVGKLERCIVLEQATVTETGLSAYVDWGVTMTDGGAAYLSVTAVSGISPTCDITVKHCATAEGVYEDLTPAFTQVIEATSERIVFTGIINRYLKISYTVGGTDPSFTFICVFHGN